MRIICSWCKRQKRTDMDSDDQDAWMEVENIPGAELCASREQKTSHGICPDCLAVQLGAISKVETICMECSRIRDLSEGARSPRAWREPSTIPAEELPGAKRKPISIGICPQCIALHRAQRRLAEIVATGGN